MNDNNIPVNLPDKEFVKENEVDLLDLIGVIFKHKWLIIGITLAVAIYIFFYAFISIKLPPEESYLPNTYTPKSLVLINGGSSSSSLSGALKSSGLGSLAALTGGGGSSSSALAQRLAGSNSLLDTLADEFNLPQIYGTENSAFPKSSIRRIIKSKLVLTPDSNTGTMEIGYTDIDKKLATEIVNRTVYLLEAEFKKIDSTSHETQKLMMEDKLVKLEVQIKNLEEQLVSFQKQYGVLNATSMAEAFSSQVMGIKTSMIGLDAEIEALTTRTGVENPIVLEKLRAKRGLENSLKTLVEDGDYGLPPMNDMYDLLVQEERMNREIEVQSTIYEGVLQQYEMLKLSDKGTTPTFQVIEKAEIPEIKSGPSRGRLCVITTMGGFFFSLFAAFLLEFWLKLRKDPERMKKLWGKG